MPHRTFSTPLWAQRLTIGVLLALVLLLTGSAYAQAQHGDQATAYQDPTTTHAQPAHGAVYNVFSAVCWYLPNRFMDFIDIPKIYLSAGDGNGLQLRMTKYMDMTWINNDAYAVGIANRESLVFFGESRDDRHFGFLAAQQGKVTGDPTEVGLAAHLIVLGGHIGLSLGEAADFFTGIVGIDLMGDDHGPTFADYTPQPEFRAGKKPVPTTALQPSYTVPDPVLVNPSSEETTGTTTMSTEGATTPAPAEAAPAATAPEATTPPPPPPAAGEDKTFPTPAQ